MDQRDDITWIALELSKQGEDRVEDGTLAEVLEQDLDAEGLPLFIPSLSYTKNNKRITLHLMEGYVFVGSGLPETRYFALERKPYINQVMSSHGGLHQMRTLSVIDNSYIEKLRDQLRDMVSSDIDVGDRVQVLKGRYRTLEGDVLGFDGDKAFVSIELRSLKVIATIPKVFLESIEDPLD